VGDDPLRPLSFNKESADNNTFGAGYQLMLDFAEDVAELEQPAKYRPAQPR